MPKSELSGIKFFSILLHGEILEAADKAVLKESNEKNLLILKGTIFSV
jgi:hypothetical protein